MVGACVILAGACSSVDKGLLSEPDGDRDAALSGDGDGVVPGDGDAPGDGDGPTGDGDGDATDEDAGSRDDCLVDPDAEVDPTCPRPHAVTTCFEGACYVASCQDGYLDCNENSDDGCEAPPDSLAHCGGCNRPCELAGVGFLCVAGVCEPQGCLDGFGDCDGNPDNGCETDLKTTRNCGGCGNVCAEPLRASPACIDGVCGAGPCQPGYGDCDDEIGCELALDAVDHCGGCDVVCDLPGAISALCEQGECRVNLCEPGVADCNGLGDDGCEAAFDDPQHCGGCGEACDLPNTLAHLCDAGTCLIDHGCPNGAPGCQDGAAENGCVDGYADCNGNPVDGCEADLSRQSTCGACDVDCRIAGTVTTCTDGSCDAVGCEPGYGDCEGNGCMRLNADAHCGACGNACEEGIGEFCFNGGCTTVVCNAGEADCNGDAADDCETRIDTIANCRACGVMCTAGPQATPVCAQDGCSFSCDGTYLECDDDPASGCEVDGDDDPAHCGGCDNDCNQVAGVAVGTCNTGICVIGMCSPMQEDCNGDASDGCEVNLGAANSCGRCGNDCTALPNTMGHGCNEGTCTFTCVPGFADCNADPDDGCEADLTGPAACGSCGNDCTALGNVGQVACAAGTCTITTCAPNFGDCDGSAVNGCEESLQGLQSCGGCGVSCAPAYAGSASCPGGACTIDTCQQGRADCNGDAGDGCEVDSGSDPNNCGGCGNSCGGGECNGGICGCADDGDCADGLSCCSGECVDVFGGCRVWPCATGPGNPDHCGGCGVTCPLWCCNGL